MYDLSNISLKWLRFLIISRNKDKIKKTIENILNIFHMCKIKETNITEIVNNLTNNKQVKIHIAQGYDIIIDLFDDVGSIHGQRGQFVFIDEDIEITQDDITDIIIAVSELYGCSQIFTSNKGYILI